MRYAIVFGMLMAALFDSGVLAVERPPNIIYILADDLGYGVRALKREECYIVKAWPHSRHFAL